MQNSLPEVIKIIEIKELTKLESLKLALKYSTSRKHKLSLIERIAKMEGKATEIKPPESKPKRNKPVKMNQQSFL